MSGALKGVLVADFTHVFSGPYCTMMLADMGAEVIKIESPNGDPTRDYREGTCASLSPSFLSMNRNKRSVVLDLSNSAGRKLALKIAKQADVLVENFSTGVMEKFGLDYQLLVNDNPGLIYCSISGYGRQGPLADRAGYDPVVQAESGMMSLNGHAHQPPFRSGIAFIDLTAGLFAANAILAALYARSRTSKGQYIDVPLFDTGVSLTSYHALTYLLSGQIPTRVGNQSAVIAPAGLYAAADGEFVLTVAGDKVWSKLVAALDYPQELKDECFQKNNGRLANKAALDAKLGQIFKKKNCAHWIGRLQAAGVPAGLVRDLSQALDSFEVQANELIVKSKNNKNGVTPSIRFPMRLSNNPLNYGNAAPELGADLQYVLEAVLQLPASKVEFYKEVLKQ